MEVEAEKSAGSRSYVVVALMLAMALTAMDATIVATAIPSIVRDVGGFSLFPWVFSIYLLTQAASIPIYGKLADIYGRKPVLMVGAFLFLAGSLLSGLSWNMVSLIVFRGMQGVGAGAIQPIATTIAGDLFSVEERARVQGYLASVWGISAVLGPTLGGIFVQYASWRWVFFVNLPIGVAALLMIGTQFKETVHRRSHPIDYGGALLLVLSIGTLVMGLLEGGVTWPWASWPSVCTLGGGFLLFAGFIYRETRVEEPIMPLWVFKRRILVVANLGGLFVGILTIGLSSYLPTFVQGDLRQTPLVAGLALAAMSIGWPLSSALSGKLYLRIGFRWTTIIGAGFTMLSGVLLVHLSIRSSVANVALASFVMGVGLGFASTSLVVALQSVVPWNRRGVATGSNMFTRMLGSSLGAAVYGSVVNSFLNRWFRLAPLSVSRWMPRSVNAATLSLAPGTGKIPEEALNYIRQGLNAAIHRVFLGVFAVAILALAVALMMPRKTTMLDDL